MQLLRQLSDHKLSYEERLPKLELPFLVYRRARGDMIETYKYINSIYDVNYEWITLDSNNTRGHTRKLAKGRCKQENTASASVKNWNSLPDHVVCAPSTNAFKARLDRAWAEKMYLTSEADFAANITPGEHRGSIWEPTSY